MHTDILCPVVEAGERFAFSMCNPPFFSSLEEAGRNPATAFQGTAAEMVWPGGELAFVTKMVEDSLTLKVLQTSFLFPDALPRGIKAEISPEDLSTARSSCGCFPVTDSVSDMC